MSPLVFGERYYLACHCPESELRARGVFNTYTMERESFVFYRSFYEGIKELPRDIQGEVLTAIMEYGLNGVTTENQKPITKAMFALIKPQLDANNQRFENGKLGAEHGVKGGRPRKEKPQENPTETPNVNDNVNVNDNFIKQTNKQTHTHEEKPKTEKSTLTAYEDFKGDTAALVGWLSKRWNDAKKFYKVGAIGNVAILGNARINLIEVAKNYTQGEIELAIKGVFIQKEIYPQFTLSPDKMLEPDHFSTFYNAGLTNTQLYNKEPQKGQKSSKKGVVRNIGDL